MPHYRLHVINSEFQSWEEGEFPSAEKALRSGVVAALEIASESLMRGESNTAVEVRVEQSSEVVARQVLSLSIAKLSLGGEAEIVGS